MCRTAPSEQCLYERETLVVRQHLDNGHRGKQIQHQLANLTHIAQEYVFGNEFLAQGYRMLCAIKEREVLSGVHGIDERGSSTHEQHPAHRAAKDSNKGFVDMGNMLCGNEQVTQEYHNYYRNGHFLVKVLDTTYIFWHKNTQKKQNPQDRYGHIQANSLTLPHHETKNSIKNTGNHATRHANNRRKGAKGNAS